MTSCDPRRGIEGAYLGDVDDAIVVGEVRVRDVPVSYTHLTLPTT